MSKQRNEGFKNYINLAHIANIFVALSTAGLTVLGVVSTYMAMWTVIGSACVLGILGFVGRYIKQDLADNGKMFWEEDDK
jgi:hypothetical protein